MPFYLGAFLAVALEWRAQAINAVLQAQTLQALETRVTALEEEKKTLECQNKAYQGTLKQAQEAKEKAEKQLAELTGLQDLVEADAEVQKDLKDRCYEQADEMERMEGDMATQAKAVGLLQADYDKLQVEVSRLRVEKETLEKQVASGDATMEEKDKKALIQDMAGTFDEGFQEALAQAVCMNSGIDISNCDSTHHIVDGKVVPLEMDD
ncbi:uncharacterized protein [Phaseolus vulgaris]|uniref:uncharacterized protein n=1 Tax=Phaseolus vulgaris TaxID=3885 RepID=UPI0035CC4EDC